MTNQFSANAHHLKCNQEIWIAMMRLALDDYRVIRTVSNKHEASIEIDRPYENVEPKISQVAEKTYGSTERYGCRIYWRIA